MVLTLELLGLIVLWVGVIIGQFIWIKVKLKELEMMIINNKTSCDSDCASNEEKLEAHIMWGKDQQMRNEIRFKELIRENKEDHKDMMNKIDTMLVGFNDLRVYIEKKHK
jgi:hypothetical protein